MSERLNMPIKTVNAMVTERFQNGTPRSEEYQAGFRDAMFYRLAMVEFPPHPYPIPSAQTDAYFSGIDGGHLKANLVIASLKELAS